METFYDVVTGNQLILVDFFATWCQPCKMMHPILKQVKDVLGDRIRIIKIDVDTHSVLSQKYQIQSVPTLMLFRNGEVLWRTSGVMQKAELLSTIDPFLKIIIHTKNNIARSTIKNDKKRKNHIFCLATLTALHCLVHHDTGNCRLRKEHAGSKRHQCIALCIS